MGATNHTTYYNLSQFIGTDKPAWLQDYNGDMSAIDLGLNAAKVAADNAGTAASNAQGDATQALTDVGNLSTTVGTLSNNLGTAQGAINTINALIGNGTPTTTDQTIIGAINEINGELGSYQYSGLHRVQITSDGVKDIAALMEDLASDCLTYFASLANGKVVMEAKAVLNDRPIIPVGFGEYTNASATYERMFDRAVVDTTQFIIRSATVSSTSANNAMIRVAADSVPSISFTTESTTVPAVGRDFSIWFSEYEIIS